MRCAIEEILSAIIVITRHKHERMHSLFSFRVANDMLRKNPMDDNGETEDYFQGGNASFDKEL